MIVRSFIDSNVFVYTDDPKEHVKRAKAVAIVDAAHRTGLGVVSTQVLQEYFSSATKKLGAPIDAIRKKVRAAARLHVVQVDPALILAAIDLHQRYAFSFWDALIVQAASRAGCAELLTEDLQHGQKIAGLTVINPFV